ncbi:Ubiquitin-conjugating enzyme subunit [Desmophyllum pertusum]|uniref:Ubiquitin-conjugating enzyme subunit n=1 Tax=Desmophyllum pertusum TaxID=174260 RepID=A0A9X0CMS1_9CNID|nr:Ubiquitin-conjugating enzyme subunit [Desmophyllum pertusum]
MGRSNLWPSWYPLRRWILQGTHVVPFWVPLLTTNISLPYKMWHPNIYESGDVCISILHPPVDDPQSGELPSERWNPTQNVRTILLSVISLLNEPNTFSPANVDASVMFRKWRDTKGKDGDYERIVKKQVQRSKVEAEKENIKVPTTVDEYCVKSRPSRSEPEDLTDFYDDDYADDVDDDDDDDDCMDYSEDSGNEET